VARLRTTSLAGKDIPCHWPLGSTYSLGEERNAMTTQIPYTPPTFWSDGFNCPFCHAFAKQEWGNVNKIIANSNYGKDADLVICRCSRCEKFSVWVNRKMVAPAAVIAPPPNADIADETKVDYEEARTISCQSPRGAAALLRLCIQKLCKQLGETGDNINDDVASLVRKGLPPKVQKALDVVRVVGNNAVHPGQIDLNDTPEVANKLFGLVNIIADVMISQPKQINEIYETVLPEAQKKAIARRDSAQLAAPPNAGSAGAPPASVS